MKRIIKKLIHYMYLLLFCMMIPSVSHAGYFDNLINQAEQAVKNGASDLINDAATSSNTKETSNEKVETPSIQEQINERAGKKKQPDLNKGTGNREIVYVGDDYRRLIGSLNVGDMGLSILQTPAELKQSILSLDGKKGIKEHAAAIVREPIHVTATISDYQLFVKKINYRAENINEAEWNAYYQDITTQLGNELNKCYRIHPKLLKCNFGYRYKNQEEIRAEINMRYDAGKGRIRITLHRSSTIGTASNYRAP